MNIESCSICLEPMGKACMTLECGHIYHSSCGIEWLKKHNSCPLCRDEAFGKKKKQIKEDMTGFLFFSKLEINEGLLSGELYKRWFNLPESEKNKYREYELTDDARAKADDDFMSDCFIVDYVYPLLDKGFILQDEQ